MRILYLGLPLGALMLRRAGHEPDAIALGHPNAPGGRRLRRECSAERTLLLERPDLRDRAIAEQIAERKPDALLSFFWPRAIPNEILAIPPLGAFGTHPSLLPRWRGPDPYFWAIRMGDRITGVTLHRLEEAYDTGDIIDSIVMPIPPGANSWTLARSLDRPAIELLRRCASRLARGERLEGRRQPEDEATYAPFPSDEDLSIDWTEPADDIVLLVRACAPEPGARARLGDHEVDVLRARISNTPPPRALRAAEAFRGDEGVTVVAGEGAVVLEQIRDETGELVDPGDLLGI